MAVRRRPVGRQLAAIRVGFVGGRKVTGEKYSAPQALVLAPGAGEIIPARPKALL